MSPGGADGLARVGPRPGRGFVLREGRAVVAVGRKQDEADGHVHEVTLPDGAMVTTGPPVALPASAEEAPAEPGAEYPNTLRAKDLQPCIDKILADPDFQPQEGRTREESARAICAANEQKYGKARDPEADFHAARVRASVAEGMRDATKLPGEGQTIFTRMRASAIRFAGQGKDQEGYAEELAWRAIRQNYGLGEFAGEGTQFAGSKGLRAPDLRVDRGRPSERDRDGNHPAVEPFPALAKRGGFIVRISSDRAVAVPAAVATTREAAAKWVRSNWPHVLTTAYQLGGWKALRTSHAASGSPIRTFHPPFHVEQPRLKWLRQSKIYYRTPEKASGRIAYGEAYTPWEVDLQGQYATADEVVRMAHDFMLRRGKAGEMHARWVMPDGSPAGEVVESFTARPNDPDFEPGSWVLGTKYHPEVWKGILSGQYRGLSIGGEWSLRPLALRVAAVLEEAA